MNEVTSIGKLKEVNGEVVPLPPFKGEEPFFARLKKPSIYTLMKNGKIPNNLLNSANEVLYGQQPDKVNNNNETDLKGMAEFMFFMVEEALVEPTLQELEENNISLTDEQIVDIFMYTQEGIEALSYFHKESKNIESDKHGSEVKTETESYYGNM